MAGEPCGCGDPQRAAWRVEAIIARGGETSSADEYACHFHRPGAEQKIADLIAEDGWTVIDCTPHHIDRERQ